MNRPEWKSSSLADLVDDTIGGLWGSAPESTNPNEEDVLVIRGADFRNWESRRSADAAHRRVTSRSLLRRILRPGDLVLEVSGGGPSQPVGRVLSVDDRTIDESAKPLITSNFCRKLRLKPGVDPFFVKRQLDWLYKNGHTERFQTSTTNIRNLKVDDFLADTEIILPSLEEQQSLTHLIDRIESKRLGSAGHLNGAKLAIERFRQSVLAAACSGRLTADWRGDNVSKEPAEAVVARSIRTVEATKHAPALREEFWVAPDWLELPESWRWAPLKELALIRGGIQKQPKRTPRNNAYPYLRVANVLRGRLDLSEIKRFELFDRELETYRLEPGDLLIVEGNGSENEIGRCAIWTGEIPDCVHQNHIIRVRCIEMEPEFVNLFWNSPLGAQEVASRAVTTAGLYSLSTKKIGSVLVPVPPLEEQQEVIRRSTKLLELANTVEARLIAIAHALERSSQAVLAKAFRGELLTPGSNGESPE